MRKQVFKRHKATVAKYILATRKKYKVTQKFLAKLLKVNVSTINEWETEKKLPTAYYQQQIVFFNMNGIVKEDPKVTEFHEIKHRDACR